MLAYTLLTVISKKCRSAYCRIWFCIFPSVTLHHSENQVARQFWATANEILPPFGVPNEKSRAQCFYLTCATIRVLSIISAVLLPNSNVPVSCEYTHKLCPSSKWDSVISRKPEMIRPHFIAWQLTANCTSSVYIGREYCAACQWEFILTYKGM